MGPLGARGCVFSAKPPARTTSEAPEAGTPSRENRPSGPVTVLDTTVEPLTTDTEAPETTAPDWSWTTPETEDWAKTTPAVDQSKDERRKRTHGTRY